MVSRFRGNRDTGHPQVTPTEENANREPGQNGPNRLRRHTDGVKPFDFEFQYKMAGLVALRAKQAGLKFELFSNVEAARCCNDLVLRVLGPIRALYFVQLKHAQGEQTVGTQDFKTGDFNIAKFFYFFEELREKRARRCGLQNEDDHLLLETTLKDAHFLLYTTKTVRDRPALANHLTDPHGEDHVLKKLAEDLFLTGDGGPGDALYFDTGDKEIWNLFSGDACSQVYRSEFLPRFKVFAHQCHADDLDYHISQEIKIIFGSEVRNAQEILDDYLRFLKIWAQDDTQDYCLTEETLELQMENILAAKFRQKAKVSAGDLVFEEVCPALRDALDALIHPYALRVTVFGMSPGLRAAKMQKVLDGHCPGRWAYVDEETFSKYSTNALHAVCRACDVLVLDTQGSSEPLKNLIKTKSPNASCKMVELCAEKKESTLFKKWTHIEDDWTITQLTHEAQGKILDRLVQFQDKPMELWHLESMWPSLRAEVDSALLGALARGDRVALGAAPPPADDGALYIPRTLVFTSDLDPNVLREDFRFSSKVHLTLSGFPQSILEEMRVTHKETNFNKNSRWTALSANSGEEEFERLCHGRQGGSVHWIECVRGESLDDVRIVWKRTFGDPSALVRYVGDVAGTSGGAATVLLLEEGGRGKSSFLRHAAAAAARLRRSSRWVVYVEALAHTDLLKALPPPKDLTVDHAERLLQAAAGIATPQTAPGAEAARRCLKAALSDSRAVDVFVDGVGEISAFDYPKMKKLLGILQQETNLKCVSARPGVVESLRGELRCVKARLHALSREEQEMYLRAHWAAAHLTSVLDFWDLATQAAVHLGYWRGALMKWPMYVQYAAEALVVHAAEKRLSGRDLFGDGGDRSALQEHCDFFMKNRQHTRDTLKQLLAIHGKV